MRTTRKIILWLTLSATALFLQIPAGATRFKSVQVIDNETVVLRFQDGDGAPGTHPGRRIKSAC